MMRDRKKKRGRQDTRKRKALREKMVRLLEREGTKGRERRRVRWRVDTFEEGSVDAVAPASQWLLRHSSARAYSFSKRFRAYPIAINRQC